MPYVLLNGVQLREEEAFVSVNDRGLRFGDGVFETIAVHAGLPYLWEYHAERLDGGLAALHIACDVKPLLAQALALIRANKAEEGLLRIQVSRGVGSKGYLPTGSGNPTIVIQTTERPTLPPDGVTLWLSTYRKISPCALPTHFKLAQGLNSTLARMEAAGHDCFEALQLGEDDCVSEASSANIFWRAGGKLYTPSLANGALAGTMRRRVIELVSMPMNEGSYSLDDFMAADAVILTNAALGAVAVASLSPKHKKWESLELAHTFNALIKQDIERYNFQLRESLART